ncbi:MAG: hypothetical protein U0T81_18255 [Saprospiraceae bacterium]
MFLVSPSGQILELSTDNGGGNDNLLMIAFCDTATTNITAGAAPFNGVFLAEGSLVATACGINVQPTVTTLSDFTVANGTWSL